jgi:hypothetical protein
MALKGDAPYFVSEAARGDPGEGASVRVVGRLEAFCASASLATLTDGDQESGRRPSRLDVDTEWLDVSRLGAMGCLMEFIGELEKDESGGGWRLKARTCRCVDGMNMELYQQVIPLLRRASSTS